ncbi:hypothetical protein PS914_03407 [Pseudomonas fluorescens]|nr:hypothetical protein PS914_03407 [Pseudomonas fluorescens]
MLPSLIQRMDFLAVMPGLRKHFDQAPRGQILINVKVRQSGNADAGNRHAPHRLAIVRLQVALHDAINDAATLHVNDVIA